MRLFSSPRRTQRVHVSRRALVVSMMLAIFQLPAHAQGKERPRGVLNLLSQDTDRWTLHLLQRGRAERRANAFAVARASFLIPDVRAPVLSAFRSLSPGSARLSGLWPQRLAE